MLIDVVQCTHYKFRVLNCLRVELNASIHESIHSLFLEYKYIVTSCVYIFHHDFQTVISPVTMN